MIQWWMPFFFVLIKYSCVNCTHYQCNYTVNKFDNSSDTCVGDRCYKFVDLYSIMVSPNSCKTSLLFLSFSSYKNFLLFRDRVKWKLGDLFPSQSINEVRQLTLFIDRLDSNDQPFDHDELIRLGINIDLYTIYIRNMINQNYLQGSIHYDPNNPEWNIIKIKFRCLRLSAFDRYPCSSEILSPSVFQPQRPPTKIESTTILTDLSSQFLPSFSTEESLTKSKRSTHLALIILIPLLSVFILILLIILVYTYIAGSCCFKKDTETTPKSSTETSTSDHLNNTKRISSSSSVSLSDIPIVPESTHNGGQLRKPSEYHDCHRHTKTRFIKNLDNNYEKVTLDNISLNRQQHFISISSPIHF